MSGIRRSSAFAPVLNWRLSHQLSEHPGKVIGIFDPQLIGDLFYPQLCVQQVLTGLLDLQVVEVLDRSKARLLFKEG